MALKGKYCQVELTVRVSDTCVDPSVWYDNFRILGYVDTVLSGTLGIIGA